MLADGTRSAEADHGSAPGPVVEVLTLGAPCTGSRSPAATTSVATSCSATRTRAPGWRAGDYIGGTIGRYANRMLRAASARRPRGGRRHPRPRPQPARRACGFDRRLWDVVDLTTRRSGARLVSPDGDQGFPGTVHCSGDLPGRGTAVQVVMEATTDATTVVNLTNHAYLNLDGEGAGTIDDQLLTVPADEFTPVDATGIPLGEPRSGRGHAVRLPPADEHRRRRPHGAPAGRRTRVGSTTTTSSAAKACVRPRRSSRRAPARGSAALRPAGAAGLHRQLPRRHPTVHEGRPLPPGRRRRTGAAAVPRLSQPAGVALSSPAPGGTYRASSSGASSRSPARRAEEDRHARGSARRALGCAHG